jgi:hypothetical protein
MNRKWPASPNQPIVKAFQIRRSTRGQLTSLRLQISHFLKGAPISCRSRGMATRGLLSANILNGCRRADLPMNSVPDRTRVSRKQGVCMLLILLRLLVLPVPGGTHLFAEIIETLNSRSSATALRANCASGRPT